MNKELAIKVYDIDYSFILKNYLDQEMWSKRWTLFTYKNINIYLKLESIILKKPIKLEFGVEIECSCFNISTTFYYDLDNSNINILKKQINGRMEDLIKYYENDNIQREQDYKDIENSSDYEEDTLTRIAEEYLDENGVSNNTIRDAYIEKYVDKNKKTDKYLEKYIASRKYKSSTDLWLIFYHCIKSEAMYEFVLKQAEKESNLKELLEEAKEYIKIFDDEESKEYKDYVDNVKDNLEDI